MPGRKRKNKGRAIKHVIKEEDVFEILSNLMSLCDALIDEEIRSDATDVTDPKVLSDWLLTAVVALEFAYVCYRRRVKILYDELYERTRSSQKVENEDVNATIDEIRVGLREFMGDVMHEDGLSFRDGIEIVPLDEMAPEYRINMKGGDA